MDIRKLQAKADNIHDLADLLNVMKESISLNLNVATLAQFVEVYKEYDATLKFQILKVKPFPINEGETEHIDYVYCFKNVSFNSGDYLLVIYTDRDFRDNLQLTNGQILSSGEKLHTTNYGVVIPIS